MSRAQTAVKKGRAASSRKSTKSAKSRRAGAQRRPLSRRTQSRRASAMAGSKGKGRIRQGRQGPASRAANQVAREEADVRAAAEAPRAEVARVRGRPVELGDERAKGEVAQPPTVRTPRVDAAERRREEPAEPVPNPTPRRKPGQQARDRRAGLGFRDDE